MSESESVALIRKLEACRRDYEQEVLIVDRIWEIFGSPSYASLNGKSIYDLVNDVKLRAINAEAKLEPSPCGVVDPNGYRHRRVDWVEAGPTDVDPMERTMPVTGTCLACQREAATRERLEAAEKLALALQNLVNKLKEIEPHLTSMATVAYVHGARYTGPNYEQEHEDAILALAAFKGVSRDI